MDQKIVNIQAVRAMAALGVLASHLYAYEARYAFSPVLPAQFFYGFAGVDLFFAVSGFVMVLVTRGRFGGIGRAGEFLFSRAWRIYPPYWLFTGAAILGLLAMGELGARLVESPLLPSLTLWPMAPQFPLLQVGWTLTHELYFYIVFALFLMLPQRFLPVWLALWALVPALGWAIGLGEANAIARLIFSPMTLEFILGAFAALLVVSGRRRFGWTALALGVAGLALGSLWFGPPVPETFEQMWRRTAAWGVPCALIVYGAVCVELDRGARAPRAAVALGDWSYSLYLLHFLVLAALARLWADRFAGPWDNIAVAIVGAVISIRLARLSFRAFERPVLAAGARLRTRLFPRPNGEPAEPRVAARIW
jgi:peptidoglycan/LPS O-acetylase OafA/YrhL